MTRDDMAGNIGALLGYYSVLIGADDVRKIFPDMAEDDRVWAELDRGVAILKQIERDRLN